MSRYLLLGLAASLLLLAASARRCQHVQRENTRLADNQRALLSDVTLYRTKDSLSAASVERLTLTNGELERHNGELTRTVRSLGVKVRRLERASRQVTHTELDVSTPVRDTVILHGATPVSARVFEWRDSWVSVSGVIRSDTVSCRVASFDTLVQAVYRIPKRFWFFRWGTRAVRQEVVSKNPHTRVVYTEYIELRR